MAEYKIKKVDRAVKDATLRHFRWQVVDPDGEVCGWVEALCAGNATQANFCASMDILDTPAAEVFAQAFQMAITQGKEWEKENG